MHVLRRRELQSIPGSFSFSFFYKVVSTKLRTPPRSQRCYHAQITDEGTLEITGNLTKKAIVLVTRGMGIHDFRFQSYPNMRVYFF